MAKGRYIVLEGIDGSGTTTQSKIAADWLRTRGVGVVETHEPTDGILGKIIRKALQRQMPGREGEELTPQEFALLFATDRVHHTYGLVVPELENGQWVVSDRCYLSSFAYQSIGCDLDWVRAINRYAPRADLLLLLDVDAATAYGRLGKRTLYEIFERPDRLAAIRDRYLEIADLLKREGHRIVRIDASRSAATVADEVRSELAKLL